MVPNIGFFLIQENVKYIGLLETFPSLNLILISFDYGRVSPSLASSPVRGTEEFISNTVPSTVKNIQSVQEDILLLQDPQVELHLFRSCLSVCKVNHLLRCVPPKLLINEMETFDANTRFTFSELLGGSIPDFAWRQASLPFRLGGIGLREANKVALAAFIASCNMAKHLIEDMLHNIPSSLQAISIDEIVGEDESSSTLVQVIGNSDCFSKSTQRDLYVKLDELQYKDLLMALNIHDKARFNALSNDNDTSSWLKAAPIPSLAMPKLEFCTYLRICLGIPFIPEHPPLLCACSRYIDPYGDHLIGCSYDPYRIRRHDALRDIIWHALQQDNSKVRREQTIFGDNRSRPRDVYHPDFTNGKPTYFDVSVRNTLQPSSIIMASTNAGVASSSGE